MLFCICVLLTGDVIIQAGSNHVFFFRIFSGNEITVIFTV